MNGALTVRTVIDGTEYTGRHPPLGTGPRPLLKDRIGDEPMRELLTEDLRAADRAMAPLPDASGGAWRSAVTEMEIGGITSEEFQTW
ncbi:hypothetical protein ABZ622_22330 [Streptomyces sp. NPDC007164]|uniref:hypothetical protein n=1 Tax=Streptomyces sp. NPDC007164 TaxID=3156918 RepID=UPI003400D45B